MFDPVHDVQVGLKELAAEDRSGWSEAALSDRLREEVGLRERTDVKVIQTLAEWDRRTAWADDGAVTPVSWLKHQLDIPPGEAASLIRLARHYADHTVVRDAVDGFELSVAKLRMLARAERGREELYRACVDGFVELAGELSLGEFTEMLVTWAELVDDDAPPDESKHSWRSSCSSGMGRGVLNGSDEDLNIVQAALDALDHPDPVDGPEPPRSKEQRQYDLMIDIFRRVLADRLGEDPGAVSNADVIVDADVAAEAMAAPTTDDEQPLDDDELPEELRPFRDADREGIRRGAHHPDGTRVNRIVLEALLCCGLIRRILVDPRTGQPLDVGRAFRRFTPRQLRALTIRDGGCVFPGCDRRPKWCDAHHLHHWEDGGPTDLDNGVLLCRRHHRLVHSKAWNLERDPTTGVVTATRLRDGRAFVRRPGDPR